MTELIVVLALVVAMMCLLDLTVGMFVILAVGFLQDPLRKLLPDAPVYVSALVILAAAFAFIGAAQSGGIQRFAAIPGWSERLKAPILLFVMVVVAQSLATLAYTGSAVLAGIGLLVYLAPFPALLLGYSFATTAGRVQAFLWMYVALSAAMTSGVYLSWLGADWDILQSVGEPLVVYSLETGQPLELPSGFLRTPEVAAWHAASGACIALVLGFFRGRKGTGLISVGLALFFVGAVILTGRRKFLVEFLAFFPLLWLLLWRFRMAAGRFLYMMLALAVASMGVLATGIGESNTREAFEAPIVRGEGGRVSEILDRVENLTIRSVPYILDANGFLGSGAGSGSGGAQYFGGGDERVGGAAEGGLGKVLAEIGVPGILAFFWLGFRLTAQVWRTLEAASKGAPAAARLEMGLAAFVVANAFVFAGAHQAYSDPFILLMIGICMGFVLGAHRLGGWVRPGSLPGEMLMYRGRRSRQGFRV